MPLWTEKTEKNFGIDGLVAFIGAGIVGGLVHYALWPSLPDGEHIRPGAAIGIFMYSMLAMVVSLGGFLLVCKCMQLLFKSNEQDGMKRFEEKASALCFLGAFVMAVSAIAGISLAIMGYETSANFTLILCIAGFLAWVVTPFYAEFVIKRRR